MRPITAEEQLGVARDSWVVCVPVVAPLRDLTTVRRLVECLGSTTPVLFVGAGRLIDELAKELPDRAPAGFLFGLGLDSGSWSQILNAASRITFPADLLVIDPGLRIATGFVAGLRGAARSDSTIASATPMSVGYGGVCLNEAGKPGNADLDGISRRFSQRSLRLRPRIPVMGPGCVYIRRAALELEGSFVAGDTLGATLADMAVRLNAAGMVHVVAADVLIAGAGTSDGDAVESGLSAVEPEGSEEGRTHVEQGPLWRALEVARSALRSLSVTVDGRALVSTVGGTQTYIVELVLALAREEGLRVRVLTPPDLSPRAAAAFAAAGVDLLPYEDAVAGVALTDVVHRPQQVFTVDDFALLRLVGRRIVIGHQDLIAYHNHAYHLDLETWRHYRETTGLTLGSADQVVFFSEHARRDALGEQLLSPDRAHVAGIGVDAIEPVDPIREKPAGLDLADPFLLCIGADYAHKNRPFAIELFAGLRELGFEGRLVLAGAHVPDGSSREHERRLIAERPELADLVLDIGAVDEVTKHWLYANARALVYPTIYEGFGLIPVEAARAGLPCLFAAQASLAEIAGEAATLIPWDAGASARVVLPLLWDGPDREAHISRLRTLPVASWSEVTKTLLSVYERALAMPPAEQPAHNWYELDRQRQIAGIERETERLEGIAQEYQDAYHSLEARVREGLPLIDEGGLLGPAQQRGLMRIAGRGRLGALALAPFGLLGRRGLGRDADDDTREDL